MMYPGEDKVLELLSAKGKLSMEALSLECKLNLDTVRRAAESLKEKGFVVLEKEESTTHIFTSEFKEYVKKGELPEFEVFKKALSGLSTDALMESERKFGLSWAIKKGFVRVENKKLVPIVRESEVSTENSTLLSISDFSKLDAQTKEEFLRRRFVEVRTGSFYSLQITKEGKSALDSGMKKEFSVDVETRDAPMGKSHPLTRAISKMRRIFLEMGFEEMEGPLVESSFWNFDALFQPQDHPARELADTFYLKEELPLPKDKSLVERVKKAHESGWGHKWNPAIAKKAILRTHTTCLSAKTLESINDPITPRKFFAIGRVFRNERTDFKHLSEFHQVEGIVAWNKSTFQDLLGIFKEFYSKLGFEKIRFRPSYFPYTEPSLEIEVYYEPRKEWMEFGGAGMFRPEVTKPLKSAYPVLAWGLSLERPLMLMLGLNDIRSFYKNDLELLENTRMFWED